MFDELPLEELLRQIDQNQEEPLAVILQHYTLNPLERQLFPCYKRITDLFQYPNVCLMNT